MTGEKFVSISSHVRALAFAAALALAVSAAFGQDRPAATPRFSGGETINVEVKIVPFYAVDAQGKPVTDLKAEEIELRVGGAAVPVESFDRYVIQPGTGGSGTDGGQAASTPAPIPSRNVFLLFDTVFSSPGGFNTDKRLAARMLESWPAGDRLTLLVHGSRASLEKRLGPLPAGAAGKREILAAVEALQPEVRRVSLQTRPQDDFGADSQRASRNASGAGFTEEQVHATWSGLQGTARSEYITVARSFASSLGTLAAELRRVPGPKLLLIFSRGLNDTLYFEGESGGTVGTDGAIEVDVRRAPPLLYQFQGPMAALGQSGAMSVFVNAERAPGIEGDPLRDMAKTSGGLYFEGQDPRDLEARIAGSTAAYYEVGFRPAGTMLAASTAGVQISVRRPGVRAWSPTSVRLREPYRELTADAKRAMVIDVVAGGPAAQNAHSAVRLNLQDLSGKVVRGEKPGRLRFEAAWPADLAARKLDFYNVLISPPEGNRKAKVLHFDARNEVAGKEDGALETTLEGQGALVWGIVAVDPETEKAWVRRLALRAPGGRPR